MRMYKLYMPAVTLASALALAGCGGGSGTTPPPPPPEGLEPGKSSDPIGGKVYTCDDDGRTENCDFDPDNPPTTEEEAEEAGITITDYAPVQPPATQTSITRDADAANEAAAAALEKAEEASEGDAAAITYLLTEGVSKTAVENAEAILEAETEIAEALADAKAALAKAKALPDTAVGKARLVESIEDDIKEIEDDQETVVALSKMVKGPGSTARTPAYWGTEVAKDVDGKLKAFVDTPPTATDTQLAAAIASGDAGFTGSTRPDGAKRFVNALAKGDTLATADLEASERGEIARGRGIDLNGTDSKAGTFVCLAESCAAVDEGDEIGDGWYFTANADANPNLWYAKSDDGNYKQVAYLEWGVWYETGGSDDSPTYTLSAFAGEGEHSGPIAGHRGNIETVGDDDNGLAKTATYTGDAQGLSTFRASTSGEAAAPVRSGHFTADVELKATFGGSPTLEGMIDGFEGDAVNTGWKVEIMDTTTLAADGAGNVKGGGHFTHQTYGEDGKRPTGIVGRFGKDFSDGAVVGVYHAD